MIFSVVIISFAIVFFHLIGASLPFLSVYGHPSPVSYEPRPNQIINSTQTLPDKVTITFTESPALGASSLKVIGPNNERIDNNDLKVLDSGKSLSISLDKSKVIPGVYTVNWLVLSNDDGHITKGSYVFSFDGQSSQNP